MKGLWMSRLETYTKLEVPEGVRVPAHEEVLKAMQMYPEEAAAVLGKAITKAEQHLAKLVALRLEG